MLITGAPAAPFQIGSIMKIKTSMIQEWGQLTMSDAIESWQMLVIPAHGRIVFALPSQSFAMDEPARHMGGYITGMPTAIPVMIMTLCMCLPLRMKLFLTAATGTK